MMRPPSDDDTGSDPAVYARKVLTECGLGEPPICEKTIVKHLGLELKEFPLGQTSGEGAWPEIPQHICGLLRHRRGQRACIWVRGDMSRERRRMTIFHECGHAILPWHQELDYMCAASDLRSNAQKESEREAYACGCELMMPAEMFRQDALPKLPSIRVITQLSDRYIASLEATAIRYATIDPYPCAVLMAEDSGLLSKYSSHLRVRYSVESRRFPESIRPGTRISKDNQVFGALASRPFAKGQIRASAFGSSSRVTYRAECLRLGNTGLVFILLWVL